MNTKPDEPAFERALHHSLRQYLLSKGVVGEVFPECPDVEQKWQDIATAYLPDGVREFNDFPTASLGWMMYIGMAMAQFWDTDWDSYSRLPGIYAMLRDKRGYDFMDEYIREDVLRLGAGDYDAVETLVSDCATHVHGLLRHEGFEAGTPEAFRAFVACLHQLYLAGCACQLHRLGYRMTHL